MKSIAPSEKEIENAILEYLNFQPGVFAFKINTVGVFDQRKKVFRRTSKWIVPGTADILACINGRFVALEVKRPGNTQSDAQIAFEGRVRKASGYYWLVSSVDHAKCILGEFGMKANHP